MTGEDIAEADILRCTTPRHVNINRMQVSPTCQTYSPFKV